ncbi:MAG: hypothetical protein ABSF44_06890 [Candidatus Bathyarchaeia archaeon]|jgi:hypothetical protein
MKEKQEAEEKDEDHLIRIFYLDGPNSVAPKKIVELIRKFLKEKVNAGEHCPNCGGIIPEVGFNCEGTDYIFSCVAIEKDGKMIAETDYAKFYKYCR